MSRTFKLLNASAKHICYSFQIQSYNYYNVHSRVCIYMCEYTVHANKMYILYICEGIIVHMLISYILILLVCQSSSNTHGTKL